MIKIWQGICRYWHSGDKVEFFTIIFALIIVIVSLIFTSKYLGKLLTLIISSQKQ